MMEDYEPGIAYEFDPNRLPNEYLTAIGRVAACAAQTDDIISIAISSCLKVDLEYGGAITTHMNGPLKDSVLRAVAEISIDDLDALDELDNILDQISEAQSKRNRIVHQLWGIHPDGSIISLNHKARGSYKLETKKISETEITEDAEFIYDAGLKLMAFLIEQNLYPESIPPNRARFHKTKSSRKKRNQKS
ncbi:MAG: hypothetical protein NXI13_14375 [Proteobacteria bacterium]|nr:hypothetical protein [Pseudomonadota bacterium]